MKNYIIGIAGLKGSGKDTVASMINYILHVGITKAQYSEWILRQVAYDALNKDRILHFADSLKDVLSIIYGIPRNLFDDRNYKDEYYFNLRSRKFVNNLGIRNNAHVITIGDLDKLNINELLCSITHSQVYIKLRTLLQYFGTNICRTHLGDDIWIKAAMNRIVDKAYTRKLCIVPDIRFENEANAIKCNNDSLYGGIIRVIRDNCEKDNHSSETQSFEADFVIENNGNIVKLFYKVLQVCQNLN